MSEHRFDKINELSRKHPNLRNEMFRYFDEGCTAALVAEILRKKYQISIGDSTVHRFRIGSWIPYRRMLEQKRINAAAKAAVERELELRKGRVAKPAGDKR